MHSSGNFKSHLFFWQAQFTTGNVILIYFFNATVVHLFAADKQAALLVAAHHEHLIAQCSPWAPPENFPGRGINFRQKKIVHFFAQQVKNGNFCIFRTKLGAFRTNKMKKSPIFRAPTPKKGENSRFFDAFE